MMILNSIKNFEICRRGCEKEPNYLKANRVRIHEQEVVFAFCVFSLYCRRHHEFGDAFRQNWFDKKS